MTAGSPTPPAPGEMRTVRDALLHKLREDVDLFALGAAISRVVQLASDDDEAGQTLAYYVLSDVALTQKILRLANTVTYRRVANTPVTTVSRAIFVLGFDTVKTSALALLLVDGLANHKHAQSIRDELASALRASLFGRELARRSAYQGAEEASIAALFKNIGRLLVASHEHACLRQIDALVAAGGHSITQAAVEVLGCSYESLADAVLSEWRIPVTIIHALKPLADGTVRPAANRQEWMRQVASFSVDAARLTSRTDAQVDTDTGLLLTRFGAALNLDAEKMNALFSTVNEEMRALFESLNLPVAVASQADTSGLPDVLAMATLALDESADARHPSGKPVNARTLLLAGVQDAMQMRAAGHSKVNELVLLVLETLYRAMGFRFATVCLKDVKSGSFRARVALGEAHLARQARFTFPANTERDLFLLAMENDADLMISDAASEKIRDLLPAWHRALLPDARSFIVLPLVVRKMQVGFFYADRILPAPEGVPPDETALIKALKGQVLAALGGP